MKTLAAVCCCFDPVLSEDVAYVETALDVNGDGVVNNKDLNRLMKKLAGENVQIF